jgi:hypothetical protein
VTEPYLTPRDRLVLITLMIEGREVSNNDLHAVAGFRIEAPTRERLQKLDLITVRRPGRAYLCELSEEGWAWCRQEMKADAPARTDAGTRVLYRVMQSVTRHLERNGEAPSWVFQPSPVEAHAAAADLAGRIRSVYHELAAVPGDWVRLLDLRGRLGDVSRTDLDTELLRLLDADEINLAPEAEQRNLSAGDREAALAIGGKDKHLLVVRTS